MLLSSCQHGVASYSQFHPGGPEADVEPSSSTGIIEAGLGHLSSEPVLDKVKLVEAPLKNNLLQSRDRRIHLHSQRRRLIELRPHHRIQRSEIHRPWISDVHLSSLEFGAKKANARMHKELSRELRPKQPWLRRKAVQSLEHLPALIA